MLSKQLVDGRGSWNVSRLAASERAKRASQKENK